RADPERLVENRQIERLARAEPDHMRRMVGEIVAGVRMGEDGEGSAVDGEELGDLAEQVRRHRQLDAAARVGADWTDVEVPDGDRKAFLDRCGELPCELDVGGIVIKVRVEIADRGFVHWAILAGSEPLPHPPFQRRTWPV